MFARYLCLASLLAVVGGCASTSEILKENLAAIAEREAVSRQADALARTAAEDLLKTRKATAVALRKDAAEKKVLLEKLALEVEKQLREACVYDATDPSCGNVVAKSSPPPVIQGAPAVPVRPAEPPLPAKFIEVMVTEFSPTGVKMINPFHGVGCRRHRLPC